MTPFALRLEDIELSNPGGAPFIYFHWDDLYPAGAQKD